MQTQAARGAMLSLGATILAEQMRKRGLSSADVGRAIDAGRNVVCRWLSGQRRASLHYAVKLESLYGVPVPSWTQDPSSARRRPTKKP